MCARGCGRLRAERERRSAFLRLTEAENWAGLISRSLEAPIQFLANGTTAQSGPFEWTGTNFDGNPNQNNCANWTMNLLSDSGGVGNDTELDGLWSNHHVLVCVDFTLPLYCVQQ
jgi:hypothetical protein